MTTILALVGFGVASTAGLTAWTLIQREHSLLRIHGPLALYRWGREWMRDKENQYRERSGDGRPFPLVKRKWVYRASKKLPTSEGFGTQKDLHTPGTHTIRPAPFGFLASELPDDSFAVTVGRDGRHFTVRFPENRSGGSFGAFGAHWTRAASDGCGILNRFSKPGEGHLDNTGEGGLAPHHLSCSEENQRYLDLLNIRARAGGHGYFFRFDRTATSDGKIVEVPLDLKRGRIDENGRYVLVDHEAAPGNSELPRRLIVQIGPSLSGFRTPTGEIDYEWLNFVCGLSDVAGVEIKGQQGAKPNDGGTLKKEKLTCELRALRGFTHGGDYVSPERLPFIRPLGEAFEGYGDGTGGPTTERVTLAEQVDDLVDVLFLIQHLSEVVRRGLITGYKMTYCGPEFLVELAKALREGRGPDYLIVDGAEGGTGSADPIMTDHVGVHTYHGIVRTHQVLVEQGVRHLVRLVASGRIVDGADIVKVLCLGADYCNGIRGYMMATGCIQATECHSGKCPTGITTHDSWHLRGFDPTLKCVRFANYGLTLREKVVKLARVAGIDLKSGQRFDLTNLDVVTGIGKMTRGDDVYGTPAQVQVAAKVA
jgi:glutamate synthase domain-containing protein 2